MICTLTRYSGMLCALEIQKLVRFWESLVDDEEWILSPKRSYKKNNNYLLMHEEVFIKRTNPFSPVR